MHIIVALLKAGKRVACFDLDLNQLTLTRYLRNRHEWVRKHEEKLELPDHYPVTEEVHGTALGRFISRLKKIGRAHKDDFICITNPTELDTLVRKCIGFQPMS